MHSASNKTFLSGLTANIFLSSNVGLRYFYLGAQFSFRRLGVSKRPLMFQSQSLTQNHNIKRFMSYTEMEITYINPHLQIKNK